MIEENALSFEINVSLMRLYPKQYEAIFNPALLVLIEASTKSGKSDGCLVWQITQILKDRARRLHLWLSPTRELAREMYIRAKQMLPHELAEAKESSMTLHFAHGCRWMFLTDEDPDSLYGRGVGSLVIDEASRIKEDSYHAAHSNTTTYLAPIRCIGNVHGRDNWFYRLCRLAEHGKLHGAIYRKLHWTDAVDAGVMPKDAYERALEQYGDDARVRELFEAEACENTESNPFGIAQIEACITREPIRTVPIAYGCDVAGTVGKGSDWTVLVGVDAIGGVAFFDRWQSDTVTTKQKIKDIVGDNPCLIDQSGVGLAIVQDMQQDMPNITGQKFAAKQKQELMRMLSSAISTRLVKLHAQEHKIIIDELMQFEYEFNPITGNTKWSAPIKRHDDCVMALAMAIAHKRDVDEGGRFEFEEMPMGRPSRMNWRSMSLAAGGRW